MDLVESVGLEFFKKYYLVERDCSDQEVLRLWQQHQLDAEVYQSPEDYCSRNDYLLSQFPEDFDPTAYVGLYKDLEKLAMKGPLVALNHYMKHGKTEGRCYSTAALRYGLQTVLPATPQRKVEPKAGRIACLVHIFYPELWGELADAMDNLPSAELDVYVNVCELQWSVQLQCDIRARFPSANILISPNEGRDIGGFVRLMKLIDFSQYDIFTFLHTKKSPHISELRSTIWRQSLVESILGTKELAEENISILRSYGEVGMIGSGAWRNTEVAANDKGYNHLLSEFSITSGAQSCEYLSGTMMMVRPEIMKPIADYFADKTFESGDDKPLSFHMDGQVAHSIERIIGCLLRELGFSFYWVGK